MEIITKKRMMLFTGTIHPALGHEIADNLGIPVSLGRAPPVRARARSTSAPRRACAAPTCFVVQTHYEPVNEAIMEQLIMIDAMKRASRQAHHRGHPVLRLLAAGQEGAVARADQRQARGRPADAWPAPTAIVSVDLHSGQIQGYFDAPFDHLTALPILSRAT